MPASRPPIGVVIVACLFLLVGAGGLVARFPHDAAFHANDVWIELTELLAVVAGIFLLRGHNWARWLAIAWMAFHVALSWPSPSRMAVHSLILAVIVWLLFRADARGHFARTGSAT